MSKKKRGRVKPGGKKDRRLKQNRRRKNKGR